MKSLLEKVNAKLNAQGGFLKSISVLVGGTALAQVLVVLTLPILTRIYSPKDFTLFAIYSSLLMTISVASCLRFEIAIPIPKNDKEAINLVVLALISNLAITVLAAIIIYFFYSKILLLLKHPELGVLIWFVPVGILFSGIYNSFQYWATRKKQFVVIAKTRVLQSSSGVVTQIIIGLMGFTSVGLIIGQIIKVSAGAQRLGKNFLNEISSSIKDINFDELKKTFIKNKNFPQYSSFEALANSGGLQLPVLIIAGLTVGSEAGYLMLAMQVMSIPLGFIGSAVSQVYLSHAAEKYETCQLSSYTYQCILQLMKIGVIPLTLISFLAPFVFPLVFGERWVRSGEMILWMLPWFIMQLLVSPVSMSLHITGAQKIAFLLQIIGLLIRVGGLLVFSILSPSHLFEYYAISGFVFYFLFLITVISIINVSEKNKKNA